MRLAPAALFGAMMLTVIAPPARAAEFGTRQEAVAMVKRVQAKVKKDGMEATVYAINGKSKEFIDRDLYPYIVRLDGTTEANPTTPPAVTGKNVLDLRDQDGKFFIKAFIAVARDKGSGWVDYRWLNPVTKAAEEKTAYIERLGDDYLVGVGIYKNEQPSENTIGLISGSPDSDDTYLQDGLRSRRGHQ
jgi:cytochrome c